MYLGRNCGLVSGAGGEAEEAAVPAAGRTRVEAGGVAGGLSVMELEAVSKEKRKDCPPW